MREQFRKNASEAATRRWKKWREENNGLNAYTQRYGFLNRTAKNRNHKVFITLEEYKPIADSPCHYCGGELPEFGAGIDRKDSKKDYTLENCVPCCSTCNDLKGHLLSYEEMVHIMFTRNFDDKLLLGSC